MDRFQDPRLKAQNRANVQQLKLMGQSHQTGLTNSLLKLFEARPSLDFKPPPQKRKLPGYQGVSQFVEHFAEPGDSEYSPPVTKGETPIQKKNRIRESKLAKGAEKVSKDLESYDAAKDPKVDGDPYKTLFVARISYESTEAKLKREFEAYGPIRKIRLVNDSESGKPRGYAFVEYQHTRDMKTAYKQADGRKIDNRRVILDVERGRTVPNWRPRRLGGGLGSTRMGGDDLNQRHSGREPQVASAETPEDAFVASKPRSSTKGEEGVRDRERQSDDRSERPGRGDVKSRERERERERDPDRERERDRDRERGHDRDRPDRGDRDRRQSDRHERTSFRERKEERGERSQSRERDRDW